MKEGQKVRRTGMSKFLNVFIRAYFLSDWLFFILCSRNSSKSPVCALNCDKQETRHSRAGWRGRHTYCRYIAKQSRAEGMKITDMSVAGECLRSSSLTGRVEKTEGVMARTGEFHNL